MTEKTDGKSPAPAKRKSRYKTVRAPKRLLSAAAESALTIRQLEILDSLDGSVLRGDFADLTMAEIAKRMTCSLRTLYGIAPSKELLVLTVIDRQLHRIGLEAREALELDLSALNRLRAYLRATNRALQPKTAIFTKNFGKVTGAREMADAHAGTIVEITRTLLNEAVVTKEIDPLDTAALAHILGRLGREFARPEVEGIAQGTARETADSIAELIFNGLAASRSPSS